MIKLFGVTDKDFLDNGDKIIIPLKAKIHKEDNGEFYLELETDLSYNDDLIPNNILVANTPNGDQGFRIYSVNKDKNKIKVRADHLFYDGRNYLIKDRYVKGKNCNDALDYINLATDNPSEFTTMSNINTEKNYRCVRKSLCEAVFDIAEKWGGHVVRNNFHIEIRDSIGQDNGVVIRYGKNTKNIHAEYDMSKLVTKLMPVGKDGLLLPEVYLYPENPTQYELPFTKKVKFSQDIYEDSYKNSAGEFDEAQYQWDLQDDLREKGQAYVNENCVPRVRYTVTANIDKVTDVGDVVEVYDERLSMHLMANLLAYEYDCILEKYIEFKFGTFKPQLDGLMEAVEEQTNIIAQEESGVVKITLSEELQSATNKLWAVLDSSNVIIEGNRILIVDKLPKEEAVNVMMIDSGGIGFSTTGINGTFNTAFTIDGNLLTQNIEVINFAADIIKGGTLKLGSNLNQLGKIEVYDEANSLFVELNKDGLKMYGRDGSYIALNSMEGIVQYDSLGNKVYWIDDDEFHMRASVVEKESIWFNKIRLLPMSIVGPNNTVENDGVAFIAMPEETRRNLNG